MATSSIFENVRLTGNNQVEIFLNAIEASEADAKRNPVRIDQPILRDKDSINRIFDRKETNVVNQ